MYNNSLLIVRELGYNPNSLLNSVPIPPVQRTTQHTVEEKTPEKASPASLDSYVSQEISTYVEPLVTQANAIQPKIRSPTSINKNCCFFLCLYIKEKKQEEGEENAPLLHPQKINSRYVINEKRLCLFPFKTTIISDSEDEFIKFLEMWESQESWSWCLFFTVPPEFAAKVVKTGFST